MNRLLSIAKNRGANNYNSFPVILRKATGVYVEDIEGKMYLDFLE